MTTVALVGPDGAGKTTITRRLEASRLLRFKYLYMGVNIEASNFALPTSRWAERLKRRSHRVDDAVATEGASRARAMPSRRARRGLRAVARLMNRLADEWFRQVISWYYQLRGFVVLYDRHFVLDFAPEITASLPRSNEQRLHHMFLKYLYPNPDLVIFLDASGEVLFARKGESSVPELERRRQAFLRQGERLPNFVRVDAARPLDDVYEEVAEQIVRFHGRSRMGATIPAS